VNPISRERADELERLVAECCVCEKCGHVQAEPNWCHVCGHRTRWPEWAQKQEELTNAALDREAELRDRLDLLAADMRGVLSKHGELVGDDG
jgi:hypothetical protein